MTSVVVANETMKVHASVLSCEFMQMMMMMMMMMRTKMMRTKMMIIKMKGRKKTTMTFVRFEQQRMLKAKQITEMLSVNKRTMVRSDNYRDGDETHNKVITNNERVIIGKIK